MNKLVYLLPGILVLSTSFYSTAQSQNLISYNNQLTATSTNSKAEQKAQAPRPSTKTATISIEGEKTQVTLRLYNQSSPRFSTYFVEDYFVPESGGSDEGTGVRFVVKRGNTKNEKAYVHFAFLNGVRTLGQVRQLVNGKRGLIASNGWKVVSRTSKVPYSWAEEKISFQQRKGNELFLGNVYLGEDKGRAFYVITHFPAEYGDGFSPRANLIFQNLQFGR